MSTEQQLRKRIAELEKAAQQALCALENDAMQRTFAGGVRISNATIALRAALAAPQQAALAPNHSMAYPPEKLLEMADDEAGPYCTDQGYIYTRRRLLACWQALAAFTLEQIEGGIDLAALAPQQAAQAGRVPLTPEQVMQMMVAAGYPLAIAQARADFINGLRHGEVAHGIKGGQHVGDVD